MPVHPEPVAQASPQGGGAAADIIHPVALEAEEVMVMPGASQLVAGRMSREVHGIELPAGHEPLDVAVHRRDPDAMHAPRREPAGFGGAQRSPGAPEDLAQGRSLAGVSLHRLLAGARR